MLDASALQWLYLADGPLPERLEAVMERGCRVEGVLLGWNRWGTRGVTGGGIDSMGSLAAGPRPPSPPSRML